MMQADIKTKLVSHCRESLVVTSAHNVFNEAFICRESGAAVCVNQASSLRSAGGPVVSPPLGPGSPSQTQL